MPQTVPPFSQYQAPLVPLRGLWKVAPQEGDRFVNCEVNWLTSGVGNAQQIQLSGNSPVALTQIVAVSVDNSRCGADVLFQFPDSGFTLTVPAKNQGTYPVFSNALQFYVYAAGAALGDSTVFQVLNSMPPPVPVQATLQQTHGAAIEIALQTNATTAIVPVGVNGTLTGINLQISALATASNGVTVELRDGNNNQVWHAALAFPTGESTQNVPVSGIRLRFVNGLNVIVSGTSGITSGTMSVNLYYMTP